MSISRFSKHLSIFIQVIVENTGNQSLNVIVSKARLLMDNTNLEFSNTGIAQ
jgi:hypothetical protein